MAIVSFVLLLLGLICFALGTAAVPSRFQWTPFGLFFWILVELIAAVHALPGAGGVH